MTHVKRQMRFDRGAGVFGVLLGLIAIPACADLEGFEEFEELEDVSALDAEQELRNGITDAEVDSLDGFVGDEYESGEFESDEYESEERMSAELASDGILGGEWIAVERYETCNGGWPGSRTCSRVYTTERNIRPGSVSIRILTQGRPGSVHSHEARQENSREIHYSATVGEGDVFNPGKHTSSFAIEWEEYRGYLGGWDYCMPDTPCGAGQGDCDSNADCQAGLGCVHDVGGWFGFNSIVDVCLPTN